MAADGMILNGVAGEFSKRICSNKNFTVDGHKCPAGSFYLTSGAQCCCFPVTYEQDTIYFP